MVELYLMASHGYPPGLGALSHQEQSFSRLSKDIQQLAPFLHLPNQDIVNSPSSDPSLQQKEQLKSILDGNQFVRINSFSRRPPLLDVQDTHADSVLFSFRIAEHFARQEKILKLLASGEIEVEGDSLDVSMLNGLMGPLTLMTDLPPQPLMTEMPSLLYPTREFYLNEPFLDLVGDIGSCGDYSYHPEINEMSYDISELYLPKNMTKSSKQTLLVPYFERRRRARSNADATKIASEKIGPLKNNEKLKEKQSQKKKNNTRTSKERDIYSTSYLHACESLLSVIADRKHQDKTVIASLKKSGPKLPQLLSQFSASIAGTGIAVVLSVVCRVACSSVPFCASKLLSTSLGLGLVWLSWSINRLRDTVFSISRTSGKVKEKEEEMMNQLDRNLRDIYFRAIALTAVAVLRLV